MCGFFYLGSCIFMKKTKASKDNEQLNNILDNYFFLGRENSLKQVAVGVVNSAGELIYNIDNGRSFVRKKGW